jgi:hypothetical protein
MNNNNKTFYESRRTGQIKKRQTFLVDQKDIENFQKYQQAAKKTQSEFFSIVLNSYVENLKKQSITKLL